jgi:SAM-dependent methyltransferase/glycosyltransferase involved in cell wall biosynthesis
MGTDSSQHVWQRSLQVADNEATGYHDNTRRDLIDALDFSPRRALDIGCGAGATFAYLKVRHPDCETWGIEINRAAADIARTRLNHVAIGKFEEIDLAAFGISPASLDLILCADVLEHMYDPWSVVVRLKDYLADDGRLVISIPNLRYLPLLDDLAHGYFRYADWGVLDITHLRFFTRKELDRFLYETGYEAISWTHGFDPTLRAQYEQASKTLPATIDTGKLVLRNLSADDLQELFSAQFFVTAKKGTPLLSGYLPPKMGCYFWRGQQSDYLNFLASHQLLEHEAQAFDSWLSDRPAPHFEILVVHGGDEMLLARTISSAAKWLYDKFRITILASGNAPAALAGHARIGWQKVGAGDTAQCWPDIARCIANGEAEWFMILEAGDELVPQALLYLAEHALRHPEVNLIYADEDSLDAAGRPENPYLKPDFSSDYFLAFDYLGDAVALRRQAVLDMGGFNLRDDNPLRAMALRLFGRHGRCAFGHVADVLYHREQRRSLNRHQQSLPIEPALREILPAAEISPGWLPSAARIDPGLAAAPRIVVIVDACADLASMQRLVRETWGRRQYPAVNLVIFVDDGLPADTRNWLERLDAEAPDGLIVFANPPGLSQTGRINAAIAQSDAELILLLRPDAIPADAFWLEHLAAHALRDNMGLVAPKLVDKDGKLIGNALLLGMDGFAVGLGHGESYTSAGHFGRLLLPQNPSALSVDVVMFARRHWQDANGLAAEFEPGGSLVDFAMRLAERGRDHLWWPHVTLVCAQGGFAPINPVDQMRLMESWLPRMARDPAYNPNASRIIPFGLREHPQVSRLGLPWKPLPKLMAFPADLMGCGHYRVIEPFNAARKAGLIDGYLGSDHYDPLDMTIFEAGTLLLQRQVSDAQLNFLHNYRRFFKLKLIYELDDLITNLPVESYHRDSIPKDIAKRLRQGLDLCDRFIVSTEPLKEAYRQFIDDILVVPNRIDIDKWGALVPQRSTSRKPRVGWAGGISHGGDLALVIDLIKETANDVDWVFFGMCREEFRPYLAELHPGVDTPLYPAKLASLNLDLAIAPIAENHFNDCKSNLKLLEYGILGYPVIASDFGPYRRSKDFPGITLVKNRHKDWSTALRDHISNLDECARRGDSLRKHIFRHHILQDHVEEWRSAWFDF